jgi:tetratricopeptide (TPR) repeat protein
VAETVLVCDLADAAHLRERAGQDVLRAVVSRFSRDMRAVLARHGGRIEEAPGDAVMAAFAEPATALDAAVEMGAARDALNRELQSDWGVRVSTRIGLGGDRNLATRLEQTATFGEVWVDQATAEVLESAAEFESAGQVRASGKGQTVRAWRLVGLREEEEPPALEGDGIRVVHVADPDLAEGDVLRLRCEREGDGRNPFDRFLDDRPLLPEERAAAVYEALAEEAEVVLVEDAQFGNATFRELLEQLPRLPGEKPLAIVCSAGDGEATAQASLEAGRRAFARGDLTAAIDYLRGTDGFVLLGEALVDLGELDAAQEALAGAGDDPRAELARAHVASFTDGPDRLREVAERAVDETDDDPTLARAWQAVALLGEGACRWAQAADARRHQLEHARAASDRALELRALTGLAYALYFGPTPVEEAIEALEEEIVPAVAGFPVAEGTALGVLGGLESMRGRFDEARELHARARAILGRLGPALPVAEGALNAADTELLAGDAEQAELLLRGAYALVEGAGDAALRPSVAAALAQALAARDRDDEALAFTEECERTAAADDVQPQVTWRAVRATVLARRDETEEAERFAEEAAAMARETDDRHLRALALDGMLSRSAGP